MLILNKWKIRWVNCGCAIIMAIGSLGIVGYLLIAILAASFIESGWGAGRGYNSKIRSADRTPQWSADGQILVVNLVDEIYGASVDGNRLWRIAHKDTEHHLSGVFYPSLSANGEVAYAKYYYNYGALLSDSNTNHIELTDINGTEPSRLFSNTGLLGGNPPKWSTDGSRLAFSTNGKQVNIMTKRESGLSSILTFWRKYDTHSIPEDMGGYEGFWSNDSQRIAFIRQDRHEDKSIVSVANWDGSDSTTIIEAKDIISLGVGIPIPNISWAPGDDIIYFTKTEFPGSEDWEGDIRAIKTTTKLHSMRPDGSGERMIRDLGDDFLVKRVEVSPDGSLLLLTVIHFNQSNGVYVLNSDGSGLEQVYNDESGKSEQVKATTIYASWSPDGSRIAVHDLGHGGNVFTMSPDGSDARVVIGPGVQPGYGKPLPEALGR